MLDYVTWAQRWPQAAQELQHVIGPGLEMPDGADGKSEAWAQQQVRFQAGQQGGMLWRNNVGAAPAELRLNCPKCRFKFVHKQSVIRWGLANESTKQNKLIKSADLIGIMPVLITPAHVGTTIGQYTSVEVKRPGWVFNPNDPHEAAQATWATLIQRFGGVAKFSTGVL